MGVSENCRSSAGCCLSGLLLAEKGAVEQRGEAAGFVRGSLPAPEHTFLVQYQHEPSLFFTPVPQFLKKSSVSKQGTAAQLTSAKTVLVEKPWESKARGKSSAAGQGPDVWDGETPITPNSCSRKLICKHWEEAARHARPPWHAALLPSSQVSCKLNRFCQTRLPNVSFQEEWRTRRLPSQPTLITKGLTSKGCHSRSKKSTSTNHVECYLAARARALEKPSRPRETDLRLPAGAIKTQVPAASHLALPPAGRLPYSWPGNKGKKVSSVFACGAGHRGGSSALLPVQCRHPPCTETADLKELPDVSHGAGIQNLPCKG